MLASPSGHGRAGAGCLTPPRPLGPGAHAGGGGGVWGGSQVNARGIARYRRWHRLLPPVQVLPRPVWKTPGNFIHRQPSSPQVPRELQHHLLRGRPHCRIVVLAQQVRDSCALRRHSKRRHRRCCCFCRATPRRCTERLRNRAPSKPKRPSPRRRRRKSPRATIPLLKRTCRSSRCPALPKRRGRTATKPLPRVHRRAPECVPADAILLQLWSCRPKSVSKSRANLSRKVAQKKKKTAPARGARPPVPRCSPASLRAVATIRPSVQTATNGNKRQQAHGQMLKDGFTHSPSICWSFIARCLAVISAVAWR